MDTGVISSVDRFWNINDQNMEVERNEKTK